LESIELVNFFFVSVKCFALWASFHIIQIYHFTIIPYSWNMVSAEKIITLHVYPGFTGEDDGRLTGFFTASDISLTSGSDTTSTALDSMASIFLCLIFMNS